MVLAELSLNLPLLSSILLLIAGVLVGYALAFPLRGDSDAVARELRALREQNEDLESALQQQRDAYARLERRDRQRDDEWLALQASNQRMEAALTEHAQLQTAGHDRVRELIQQKDAAIANLATEREQRATLDERCHAQLQALNELRATAERLHGLQAKHSKLQEELIQKQELLTRAEEEIAKSNKRLAEREHHMRSAAEAHADAATQQLESSQRMRHLESSLETQRARINELEAENRDALNQLEAERRQRIETEEQLQARNQTGHNLPQIEDAVEERDEEIQQLQAKLCEAEAKLAQQTDEPEDVTARLNEQQALAEHLQYEVDSHRRAFDTIQRQRDEARSQRDELANRLLVAEQKLSATVLDLDRLAELEKATEGYRHQLRQQQSELQAASRSLRGSVLERDTLFAQVSALQEELEERQCQLSEASDKQETIRSQREEVLVALRDEEKRHQETYNALEAQQQHLAETGDRTQELAQLREELQTVTQQVTIREQQLQGLRDRASEFDQLKADMSALRESLAVAQQTADESAQRARDAQAASDQEQRLAAQLRCERDQALAELRSLKVSAIHKPAPLQHEQGDHQAALEHHPARGPIYLSTPEMKDDLQRISGIAAVLETRLNELGIYRFEQIMNWDHTHIDEFSKLLSFPDRIARDDWVGQAAELYRQVHGKAA